MKTEKPVVEENQDESLTAEIRSYVEKRIQLLILTISERVSNIIANAFQRILGMVLLGFALYFICLALGFYLGELLGNYSYGFAIVSTPFIVVGFILLKRKSNRITEKIQADIIEKMMADIDDSTENGNNKNLEK
tara:strand:- start:116054 stop:116458 length:405 start_codon:yes stop_codon:yes gene_type:complete